MPPRVLKAEAPIPVDEPGEPPRQTLAAHLGELRRRLGISLAAVLMAALLGLAYAEQCIAWLQRPAGERLGRLVFLSPLEPLQAHLSVGFLAGVLAAMPVVLWQAWAFIRPGLTGRERRLGVVFVVWGSLQFLLGAACAYVFLLPAALQFLTGIGAWYLQPAVSVGRYVAFATAMMWWSGIAFELPVLLWVLAQLGVVTAAWLRQQRPYAMLVLVILAALLTPTTDPVNLALLAVPLAGLYELSIWLVTLTERSRGKAQA
jgi:sec-independent protein translocase protein TatC